MTAPSAIAEWIVAAGLAGESEGALLGGFCQHLIDAGVPLARGGIIIDTLHPVLEGRAFFWRREPDGGPDMLEYGPTNEGDAAERWRASVFFHLLETGGSLMRLRLSPGEPQQFPLLAGFAEQGLTEYFALLTRFSGDGTIGEMDCVYSHWMTDRPGGFGDEDVARLAALMPSLALAVKCASLTRIAGTLAETYLGRDPGRRVLAGRISRGAAETINAALWFSDLREFTRIAERAEPHHIIPFLNDYAELAIASIHDHHGDVLKLMGDGVLAVFTAEAPAIACRSALAAEATLRVELARLNQRRAFEGLPTTEVYLGLHVGEVFYGNIGSKDRLDFTVVGPAVNEVSRIAAMCRSVERELLISEVFADAMTEPERAELVSVGRYALRGVERPQHLFTRDPFAA